MSSVHITLNDEVVVDGNFNEFTAQLPGFLDDIIQNMQPTSAQRPKPHLVAVMGTFADAVTRQSDITIDVATGPDWWTMTVKERNARTE